MCGAFLYIGVALNAGEKQSFMGVSCHIGNAQKTTFQEKRRFRPFGAAIGWGEWRILMPEACGQGLRGLRGRIFRLVMYFLSFVIHDHSIASGFLGMVKAFIGNIKHGLASSVKARITADPEG